MINLDNNKIWVNKVLVQLNCTKLSNLNLISTNNIIEFENLFPKCKLNILMLLVFHILYSSTLITHKKYGLKIWAKNITKIINLVINFHSGNYGLKIKLFSNKIFITKNCSFSYVPIWFDLIHSQTINSILWTCYLSIVNPFLLQPNFVVVQKCLKLNCFLRCS